MTHTPEQELFMSLISSGGYEGKQTKKQYLCVYAYFIK